MVGTHGWKLIFETTGYSKRNYNKLEVDMKFSIGKQRLFLNTLFFLSFSFGLFAQENNEERYHGVEIGSETRILKSNINGTLYKLLINLPVNYNTDSSKTYPVLYVLDGQWAFINVVSGYWDNHADGLLPDIIIVGLTWGGNNPNYDSLRICDYSPSVVASRINSGGGKEYLRVLDKEIIPFIDHEYRTNKVDRALAGLSLGGLYTLFAMLHANDLFNGFIIINPSLWWDNSFIFKDEEEFAKQNKILNARVFMVSGGLDKVKLFQKMVEQINSRNYQGLNLESRILDGMGHSGSKSEAHARGMLFLYKRPAIKLPDDILNEYTGTYMMDSSYTVYVIKKDGDLFLKYEWEEDLEKLSAINNKEFAWLGTYHDFHFTHDKSGKVSGFKIQYAENSFGSAKKIKLISEALYNIIDSLGIQKAVESYKYLRKYNPDDYNFAEYGLNDLGYMLLGDNRIKEAIEIFKLNVSAYPESSNCYDSLGEAYMKYGDSKLAIENYQRSYDMDNNNLNALEMIKKLKDQN